MIQEDRKSLERALSHVFKPKVAEKIIGTFENIFKDYSRSYLEKLEDTKKIEEIIKDISQREDVKEAQKIINEEIEVGTSLLDQTIFNILRYKLRPAGIIPKNKSDDFKEEYFNEVWAYSDKKQKKIAQGYFPIDADIEKTNFTPDNIFYNENLEFSIKTGKRPIFNLYKGVSKFKLAKVVVYSEKLSERQKKKKVKQAIQYAAGEFFKKQNKNKEKKPRVSKKYQHYQNSLIDALRNVHVRVINKDFQNNDFHVNYEELYRIFEQVRRRNICLGNYIKDGGLAAKITRGINEFIPMPYAVISARVKQKERALEKMIEAFYDLNKSRDKEKLFRDLYGLRVVLPSVNDVFNFTKQLKDLKEIDHKDYINKPKYNNYRSLHEIIMWDERAYEIQIRTHEMDHDAETDEKQAHTSIYKEEKRKMIEATPLAIRYIMSIVLQLPTPYNT